MISLIIVGFFKETLSGFSDSADILLIWNVDGEEVGGDLRAAILRY